MTEKQGNWYWSDNDERFSAENGPFETRDEALEAGRREDPEYRVWTGQRNDIFPMLDIEMDVLEVLGERAYDEAGEVAENWPSTKDKAAFQAELDALIKKHVEQPTFFVVQHIESHEPKEDPANA